MIKHAYQLNDDRKNLHRFCDDADAIWEGVLSDLQKHLFYGLAISLFFLCCSVRGLGAEEEIASRVKPAVNRGLAYLRGYNLANKAATGLVVYTLLSGEDSKDSPAVQKGLKIILDKFEESKTDDRLVYKPGVHHFYEAAIDVMAIEAADAELYHEQIKAVAAYIIDGQNDVGAWFYPNRTDTGGDTSITQYAILGLWAAHRANVEIPIEVFERAAAWHFKAQHPGGRFFYHPFKSKEKIGVDGRSPGTMTTAGSGSQGVIRHVLFGGHPVVRTKKRKSNGPRFGVLERTQPSQNRPAGRAVPKPIQPQLIASIEKSNRWLAGYFNEYLTSNHGGHSYYYFYTLERTASVNQWETIGKHDWYTEGANVLLLRQGANGSWGNKAIATYYPAETCFSLLFLMKATKKLLPHRPTSPTSIGEGVLGGGRGLPDDLSRVDFKNGKVKFKKKSLGGFSQLLTNLTDIELPELVNGINIPEKKIDLSNPEKLIGKKELLKSLAAHPDPRVRQVAAWAVGKTDQLAIAGLLVELLKDDDAAVAREAHSSLCWIARRPNGFGFPSDPLEEKSDSISQADQKKNIATWKENTYQVWKKWYLKMRPYETRDDFEDPEQVRLQKK